MSSRTQHDSVIDDDEELWYVGRRSRRQRCVRGLDLTGLLILVLLSPLCIEEFDLSDKNFKPCPCGYQVRYTILFFPVQ